MAKKELSERQKKMMNYISNYMLLHFRPPTIREIGKEANISSTSVVNYNLMRLVEKGFIRREADVSRGLSLTNKGREQLGISAESLPTPPPPAILRVPLVGNIVAGEPIDFVNSDFNTYDEDDMIEMGAAMIKGDPSQLFALRVSGDSMIDAMVNDGDIVILRQETNVKNGDMVAAWIIPNDTTTLKYWFYENNQVRLQPANPSMSPIFVAPENVRVQGKVELVIRHP